MKKYILLTIVLVTSNISVISMEPQRTCDLCFEDKTIYDFTPLSCCEHDASCTKCLIDLVSTSLKEKTITHVLCPNRKCGQSIKEQDIRTLNPDVCKLFCDIAALEYLNNEKHIKQCPTPNCPYSFINDHKLKQAFKCPSCKHVYCSGCLVQHAPEMTCDQAREHAQLVGDTNKAETANTVWLQKNTKACSQCKASVEKSRGCNHMTCKCKHQFCWLCLAPWKTCNCPQFSTDQNNLEFEHMPNQVPVNNRRLQNIFIRPHIIEPNQELDLPTIDAIMNNLVLLVEEELAIEQLMERLMERRRQRELQRQLEQVQIQQRQEPLFQLRAVQFHYHTTEEQDRHFGLITEGIPAISFPNIVQHNDTLDDLYDIDSID